MQLEQSFTLPFARASVWPAFADVPMLVACMPGAGLVGEPRAVEGGADLDVSFTVKLGPIMGAFQGQGAIRRDDAAFAGTFSGSGADRKSGSRVKGEAKFSIVEVTPAETRVDVAVDYSLTGSLAQFSRGAIVKELAAAMTRDFAANLQMRIAEAQPAPTAGGAENAAAGVSPTAAPDLSAAPVVEAKDVPEHIAQPAAQPLDAGKLFWRVLWARILGLFGRNPG
jgi:carbon monoxide dehydrogenase subunit G